MVGGCEYLSLTRSASYKLVTCQIIMLSLLFFSLICDLRVLPRFNFSLYVAGDCANIKDSVLALLLSLSLLVAFHLSPNEKRENKMKACASRGVGGGVEETKKTELTTNTLSHMCLRFESG